MSKPIPGPKGLPLLGMTLKFAAGFQEYAREVAAVGDVAKVHFPFADLIYANHPDHAAHVLQHNQKNYWKGRQMQKGVAIFGEGLLLAEGERWRRQRLLMAPAFTSKRVAAFGPVMGRRIGATLDRWAAGETRIINQDMMELTLEIALELLFHTSGGSDVQKVGAAFQVMSDYTARPSQVLGTVPLWVPTPANRRFNRACADLQTVVERIVTERRARADAGEDLLGMLLRAVDEEGGGMTDRQLYDELRTLLLAAHETTSVALTYTLWLLAGHPEIQEEAAVEARSGGPTPLTERALKEAMRLFPPVPVIWREAIADDQLGEYTVPAGSNVLVVPWILHRDARFFPEPERFDPGRWTPEFEAALPRFAWCPFGGGPRVCIGQGLAMSEAQLVLGEILRRFRLERADPGELPLVSAMTLRPGGPVRLRLLHR